MSKASEIQARRDARAKEVAEARETQLGADLEAIEALEIAEGYTNISAIEIPFTPGFPVKLAVRTPEPKHLKRYRDTVKPKADGRPGDPVLAAQQLAAVCLAYPDKETYQALLEKRAGIDVALGVAAVKLATAQEEEKGKE